MKLIIILFFSSLFFSSSANTISSFKIEFTEKEKAYVQAHPIIKSHNENNWAPFNFNENDIPKGFSIDYMNLLALKIGIKIEYITNHTWAEFMEMLQTPQLDVIINISKNKEREKTISFTDVFYTSQNAIFVNKNNSNVNKIEDLNNNTIAMTKGFFAQKFIEKNHPNIKQILVKDQLEALKLLALGKVDATIGKKVVMDYIIANHNISGIKATGYIDDKRAISYIRMGTSKQDTVLRDILDKAIDKVTDEEMNRLKYKWFASKIKLKSTKSNVYLTDYEKQYLKEKKQITMCIDPDWMPFEKFDKDGKHIGMTADYYNIFEDKLNTEIKVIKTKTWTESLENAKSRKCDILSLAMETPNRKKYLNFTTPYLSIPIVIATKLDVPFIGHIESIQDKSVGIPKGYAFAELLKNKYKNLNIVEVKNIDDGLTKVNTGELFGYIGTIATISHKFQSGLRGELKIAGKFDDNWELGIGVRDDDKTLFNILEKVVTSIDSLKQQQILNNWISIKYEKGTDYTLIWQILVVVFIIGLFISYRQYMLKKSIESLDNIIDSTIETIVIFKDNKLIKVNHVFLNMYGYDSVTEVLGKSVLFFIETSQREYVKKQLNKSTKPYEVNMVKRDNTVFPALVQGTQIADNLRITSVLDLSELKKKDKRLLEQSKLAAMGEMIGNIAHQWRQPLSVISIGATGIKLQKEHDILSDSQFYDTCDVINDNAQYLSKTIDDFKNFIEGDRTKKVFNLKDTIDSFLNLVNGSVVSSNIPVILDLNKDMNVDGYENELIQCLINIFNNSQDALLQNDVKEKLIYITTLKEQEKVIIKIKDNAGGIPEDVLPRIFEPYFTTKHQFQGTGLGLHMAYNIITDGMNGTIEANNINFEYDEIEYVGAEFTITLPLS